MGIRSVNNSLQAFLDTFLRSGTDASSISLGIVATGGVISDYTDSPGAIYRSHVFTSSGTFQVTSIGGYGSNVEYLVVAGGGSGGWSYGGGGGAGGFRTNLAGHPLAGSAFPVSTSPGSYTVTVGGGGAFRDAVGNGNDGSPSVFGSITSQGGGGGGNTSTPGNPGGSGGGGGNASVTSGGTGNTPPVSPSQGNSGAAGAGGGNGAGGGGAGGVGSSPAGGPGSPIAIESSSAKTYAAGGASYVTATISGTYATGNGGGGYDGLQPRSGSGGSGIVVVRYQIGNSQTGTTLATGGAISYYAGKTIHVFTSSGTFTAPASFNKTVEYAIIGGGGGGGGTQGSAYTGGGGGGAGNYRTAALDAPGPFSATITIGAGGVGGSGSYPGAAVSAGNPGGTTTIAFPVPISVVGGAGGGHGASPGLTNTFGSGGGGGYNALTGGPTSGASFPGTIGSTPPAGWAHVGGPGYPGGGSGGGGGAGKSGAIGGGPAPNYGGGAGGFGIQLPATFRNPVSTVGGPGPTNPSDSGFVGIDTSGKYWIGGGGGAGYLSDYPGSFGAGGAGGGGAGSPSKITPGGFALENTGSGGGGGTRNTVAPDSGSPGGNGGSGIVLIAYPS